MRKRKRTSSPDKKKSSKKRPTFLTDKQKEEITNDINIEPGTVQLIRFRRGLLQKETVKTHKRSIIRAQDRNKIVQATPEWVLQTLDDLAEKHKDLGKQETEDRDRLVEEQFPNTNEDNVENQPSPGLALWSGFMEYYDKNSSRTVPKIGLNPQNSVPQRIKHAKPHLDKVVWDEATVKKIIQSIPKSTYQKFEMLAEVHRLILKQIEENENRNRLLSETSTALPRTGVDPSDCVTEQTDAEEEIITQDEQEMSKRRRLDTD